MEKQQQELVEPKASRQRIGACMCRDEYIAESNKRIASALKPMHLHMVELKASGKGGSSDGI